MCRCFHLLQETDEERGRRIASQWTNDPAAAGAAVRAQQAQRQQLHAAQPQLAQSHPHHTVTAAHANSGSQTSSSEAGGEPAQGRVQSDHDSASGVQIRRDLASSGGGGAGASDGGQRSAAAAAGVVVAQQAYVLVWAVLLVGCAALGGRRLVARCHR